MMMDTMERAPSTTLNPKPTFREDGSASFFSPPSEEAGGGLGCAWPCVVVEPREALLPTEP